MNVCSFSVEGFSSLRYRVQIHVSLWRAMFFDFL